MTIPNMIADLQVENYFPYETTKLTNCLHRIKSKENPNELLLKFCHKKYSRDDKKLIELVNSFDFLAINKSKHGGRGKATGKKKKINKTHEPVYFNDGMNTYYPDYEE